MAPPSCPTLVAPFSRWFPLFLFTACFVAAAGDPRRHFDVPADIAARALKIFAQQASVEVMISAELGREIRTRAVKGEYTPRQALDQMLTQTGLTVKHDLETGVMAVMRAADRHPSPSAGAAPESSAQAKKKVMSSSAPRRPRQQIHIRPAPLPPTNPK